MERPIVVGLARAVDLEWSRTERIEVFLGGDFVDFHLSHPCHLGVLTHLVNWSSQG